MYGIKEYYDDLERVRSTGAKVITIGKTYLGRDIHLVMKGRVDGASVLIHGGMHAREYITVPLLMRLMESYKGDGGVWCVPCVNVDGMLLSSVGIESVESNIVRERLIRANGGSHDFSLWKANAKCVDLNVNYPANWGCGRYNVTHPASQGYIGEYPLSEIENQILAGITYQIQPKITLSYHTKGNVIYHGYEDKIPYIGIADTIAKFTGYDLRESKGSYGGYKDWFVATTPYLGLTMECGNDLIRHPLPLSVLDEILDRQDGVLELASRLAHEIE